MVAVIFYSPLLFQTRVAHITAEGNITHEVHITRRRRIELAHLLYRRCTKPFLLFMEWAMGFRTPACAERSAMLQISIAHANQIALRQFEGFKSMCYSDKTKERLKPFFRFMGWVMGFEPTNTGTTIRCLRPLGDTHHIQFAEC